MEDGAPFLSLHVIDHLSVYSIYLYKCSIHYVLYYGELYWQFGGKLYKDKSLIKNLFNLKSIKFFIIYVDTEHLSAKAPGPLGIKL